LLTDALGQIATTQFAKGIYPLTISKLCYKTCSMALDLDRWRDEYEWLEADPIVAAFAALPLAGPAPLDVTFVDQSLGSPTAWLWQFGDGGTSNQQNPTHTYGVGTFTVTLTVWSACGNDTEQKMAYVTVSEMEFHCIAGGDVAMDENEAVDVTVDSIELDGEAIEPNIAVAIEVQNAYGDVGTALVVVGEVD